MVGSFLSGTLIIMKRGESQSESFLIDRLIAAFEAISVIRCTSFAFFVKVYGGAPSTGEVLLLAVVVILGATFTINLVSANHIFRTPVVAQLHHPSLLFVWCRCKRTS